MAVIGRRALLTGLAAAGLAGGCSPDPPASPPTVGKPPTAMKPPADPATPSVAAGAPASPAEVVHGPRTKAAVSLTFHGQGAADALDVLGRSGVRATVFAVGRWLEARPELAGRILDGGHEFGNHTFSHVDIASLPAGAAYTEIERCAAILRKLTGSAGSWFRPSQTQRTTPALIAAARRAGYPTTISYDVDSLDYTDPDPSVIVSAVLDTVQRGSIVSLHLGHSGTVAALPAILDGLRHRGLAPVTVTDLLA